MNQKIFQQYMKVYTSLFYGYFSKRLERANCDLLKQDRFVQQVSAMREEGVVERVSWKPKSELAKI